MIDVHAHLCFPELVPLQEQIVAEAKQKINGVIVSSASYEESVQVLPLVHKHPGFLFASIGCHPIDAMKDVAGMEKTIAYVREHDRELVAIGEIGLDFHWEQDGARRAKQMEHLRQLLALAEELNKPVVLHSWDAEQACFDAVKHADVPAVIFHCYTGPVELARAIAAAGFLVSISTNVLFSKQLRKVAKAIPMEAIVLETDSPFLDPDRARKRNTPANILLSAKKIAEERGCTEAEILAAAKDNAVKAFQLKLKIPE